VRIRSTQGAAFDQRVRVSKAKASAGSKRALIARQVDGIASTMQRAVELSFTRGVKRFKLRIPEDKLAEAFERGDSDAIMKTIPWADLGDDLEGIVPHLEAATLKGAKFGATLMPTPARKLQVSAKNIALRRYIDASIGSRITAITSEARTAVQRVITDSLRVAATPKQAAQAIRESVGITPKQYSVVARMEDREREKRTRLSERLESLKIQGKGTTDTARKISQELRTLTNEAIQTRKLARMNSMQTARATTIARTELTDAVNEGQKIVWEAAADEGLVDRGQVFKEWVSVIDDDTSEICQELNGQRVPYNGTFYSSVTGESYERPSAHPNCRSAVVYDYDI
jgi:hypothetical protein